MRSKRAFIALMFWSFAAARVTADEADGDFDLRALEAASKAQIGAFTAEAISLAEQAATQPPPDIQDLAVATAAAAMASAAQRAAREVANAIEGTADDAREARTAVLSEFGDSLYTRSSVHVTVFASRSLGRQALAEIFDDLRHHPNARAVFRGVAARQSLGDGIKEILALVRPDAEGRVPSIEIDPVAFARHGITAVPSMIAEDERTGETLLRVDGGTSIAFVRRALADLEESPNNPREIRIGGLEPIEEEDLIERAKATVASVDMDALRREAMDRAFPRLVADHEDAGYPVADVHRRRIVDPTIEVVAPRGGPKADHLTAYVEPGTRINPLDMRPFTQVLVILDPTDARQPAAAQTALAAHLAAHPQRHVTWIATRLESDAGWDGLTAVEDRLGAPVYLIDERLSSRFQIERVPSLVYAEDRMFVVEEIPALVEE